MASRIQTPLIAVDVGNSRIKFGHFDHLAGDPLPNPTRTLSLIADGDEFSELPQWMTHQDAPAQWWIASVNRPACSRLLDWLKDQRPDDEVRLLASCDLPLQVSLDRPDMVGIDRLAGAVAANVLRGQGLPLVVVDLGTAITVDLVDSAGTFLGGAILPGIGMSARALHEFTDLLPLLNMETLTQPPPAVGASTMHAMQSGLYWGAIGAARELIERFRQFLGQQPQVLLTGGAAASVAALVEPAARYEPHLVLAGIALSVAASIHADR